MKLVPRYDDPPVLEVNGWVDDPGVPLLRQRRRLAGVLETLDAEQWAAPSRCEGWSVQDVVAHLIGTNQFWSLSISAGLDGAPTRFLGSFDPANTPEQMVDPMRSMAPAEILDQFTATTEEMARVVGPLTADAWQTKAESPPGHVALTALVAHALWDGWVHERDIVVPLGLAQPIETDEVEGCLRYAAAVGPALGLNGGSTRCGALAVRATEPDLGFVVDVGPVQVVVRDGEAPAGAVSLAGPAVDLVEALSFRAPLVGLAADDRWFFEGLAEAFAVG